MKLGDVYYFSTDQAIGHDTRSKFHVFLGKTSHHRAPNEYAFLFISSGNYGNCFPVLKRDYDFLEYNSFISCGNIVFYSADFLKEKKLTRAGSISIKHLAKLHHHLVGHEFMSGWQISVACDAIRPVL